MWTRSNSHQFVFARLRSVEAFYDFPLRERYPQVAVTIRPHVWGHDEIPAHERKRGGAVDLHGFRRGSSLVMAEDDTLSPSPRQAVDKRERTHQN
jgi:hypothetical protein